MSEYDFDFGTQEVYEQVFDLLEPSTEDFLDSVKGKKTSPRDNPAGYLSSVLEAGEARGEDVAEAHDLVEHHYGELLTYEPENEAQAAVLNHQQKEVHRFLLKLKAEKTASDVYSAAADAGSKLGDATAGLRDKVRDSGVSDKVRDSSSDLRDRFGL